MGIYGSLFRYSKNEKQSQKENFLTEALADLFNRLPTELKTEFLIDALSAAWANEITIRCERAKTIEAKTQVSIVVEGTVKRPDMTIEIDGYPLVVVEVKVNAELAQHSVSSVAVSEAPEPAGGEREWQDQLTTYGRWIASQGRDGWPGAVIFITHGTRAPDNFGSDGKVGVIEMTHTWKQVGAWFAKNLDFDDRDDTCCALAADLHEFLSEENLMPEFMTSQDFAALSLFLPNAENTKYTFTKVMEEVTRRHSGVIRGKIKAEPWPTGNAYTGWAYLNRTVGPQRAGFTLSVGVCFGGHSPLSVEDNDVLPEHEPFFFVFVADEYEKVAVKDIIKKVPSGWTLIHDDWSAVTFRPLANFPANPDLRVEALISWATIEVGSVLSQIPTYVGGATSEQGNDDEE